MWKSLAGEAVEGEERLCRAGEIGRGVVRGVWLGAAAGAGFAVMLGEREVVEEVGESDGLVLEDIGRVVDAEEFEAKEATESAGEALVERSIGSPGAASSNARLAGGNKSFW